MQSGMNFRIVTKKFQSAADKRDWPRKFLSYRNPEEASNHWELSPNPHSSTRVPFEPFTLFHMAVDVNVKSGCVQVLTICCIDRFVISNIFDVSFLSYSSMSDRSHALMKRGPFTCSPVPCLPNSLPVHTHTIPRVRTHARSCGRGWTKSGHPASEL
jgi:hypothetical protein